MNDLDLGSYFIKGNEIYYVCGYIDSPALELKNVNTGELKVVVIGSPVSQEYWKLFKAPIKEDGCSDVDNAVEVDDIFILGNKL